MIIRKNIQRSKKSLRGKGNESKKAIWLRLIKRVVFLFFALAFLVVLVWTLTFSSVMRVDEIVINGDCSGENEFKKVILEKISGYYLGVLPKNNLLLISKKNLIKNLKDDFKLIKRIEVRKRFPKSIIINIEEVEKHIIWCSNKKCALVDERGRVFYKIDSSTLDAFKGVAKVKDDSNYDFKLGEKVINSEVMGIHEGLVRKMSSLTEFEIEPGFFVPSSISEELKVITKSGWKIFFSTAYDIELQLKTLQKIFREKISQGINKGLELDYIDLRIKGKVFYKFNKEIITDLNDENKGDSEN